MNTSEWIEEEKGKIMQQAGHLAINCTNLNHKEKWYKKRMETLRHAAYELYALDWAREDLTMTRMWRNIE
jgi:hypothetical protein